MNRNKTKRMLSLLMTLTVALTFTLMATVSVDAASKKTVWQVVKSNDVFTDSTGDKTTDSATYKYNKNGLTVQITGKTNGEKYKEVIKRQKSGAVKSTKSYYKGKLSSSSVNTVKKGLVTKTKRYSHGDGKKTLDYTYTYTYKKGKLAKTVSKGSGAKSITTYKNGVIAKSVYTSDDYKHTTTYDKKGHRKKETAISSSEGNSYKETTTFDTSYNKKGDITKEVAVTSTDENGEKSKSTTVSKYTNKYDKHGNLIKQTVNIENTDKDGNKTKEKFVGTMSYKKFKIAKKYLKYIND